MILTVQIAPGERLKVERLHDLIGAGSAPIREALSLLTSDQLVERHDQRGFRVAQVSAEQFREILRLRCSLEDMALRESIKFADQSWEENLVLALHRVNRDDKTDVMRFEKAHKKFHMALLQRCQSPILLKFCDQLYDLNIRYRYLAGQSTRYQRRDIADEHEQILSAAIGGDAHKAAKALLNHYTTTGEFLAEQFLNLNRGAESANL